MALALPIAQEIRPDGIAGPRDIRAVRTLRISVTDRCNFRCVYCMPHDKIDWIPRDNLLTFEEIVTVARAALRHGITTFKITGGEPTVRHDLPRLVAMLRALPGVNDISMTTNGALLDEQAAALRGAGLDRLTISLDTLDQGRFSEITRGGNIDHVWRGVRAAVAAGFRHPKINTVAMKGINDDEFPAFAALTLETDVTVRFIEYMPLGRTALGGEYEKRFISEEEIRRRIELRFGRLEQTTRDTGHGPANVWKVRSAAGRIGFISAMSKPFCSTCNRLRLTAEGQLRSCLFDGGEVELRPILRGGQFAAVSRCREAAALDGADPTDRPRNLWHAISVPFAPEVPRIGHEFLEPRGLRQVPVVADALHDAFIRCVAFKPEVHSYHGNRQMSQIGG
jgi:cyclic pyranopterin phosphate synthase